jgi:hypothetical protein
MPLLWSLAVACGNRSKIHYGEVTKGNMPSSAFGSLVLAPPPLTGSSLILLHKLSRTQFWIRERIVVSGQNQAKNRMVQTHLLSEEKLPQRPEYLSLLLYEVSGEERQILKPFAWLSTVCRPQDREN